MSVISKKEWKHPFPIYNFSRYLSAIIFAMRLSNQSIDLMNNVLYITLEQARRDNRSLLRMAAESATRAAKALSLHEDLPGIYVDEPSAYTKEWLEKSISIHTKAIKGDPTLTAEQRADLGRWRNIKRSALRHIDTIQHFIKEWPEVEWSRGSDGLFYVADDEIDREADVRATLPVPSELQEQWQRLNYVLKELRELREWETNNGLTHPELRYVESMTEYKFYDGVLSSRLSAVAERYRQRQENKQNISTTIII